MSTTETEVRHPPRRQPKQPEVATSLDFGNAAPETAMADVRDSRLPRPRLVDNKSRIIWTYIVGITSFHLLIPLAFFSYFFSWWGLAWLPIGNFLVCSLGIGAGYHRLLTHRGYKCPLWLEHTLAVLGMCNLQDSPLRWVVVHRIHHQHSDHQSDPHTPQVSAFWSHVGWLFIENRETTTPDAYHKYAGDLLSDPFYIQLERNYRYFGVYFLQFPIFFAIGGVVGYLVQGTAAASLQYAVLWLLWGVIYRTLYTWHVTWAVNSAAHMWGYRNYETRENSRNNWLCALGTNGEGWHNNHHADPRSAAHGHRWWELDVTYRMICLLEKLGLAWDVVRPNEPLLNRRKKAVRGVPR